MIKQGFNREQIQIFSSLDDMISDDNQVKFIDYIVDIIISENIDTYTYTKGDSTEGRPAYSFSTMLKIYIYGYLHKITTSRPLEHQCKVNYELMWLIQGLKPDHKTISDFRKDQTQIIKEFLRNLRKKLKQLGLIKNMFSIDGTKIKANAKKDMLVKTELVRELYNLENKLLPYFKEMDKQDKEEEKSELEKYELNKKIDRLENRIHELNSCISEMEKRNQNYYSNTDPDCNLMRSRDGLIPAYNVQLAVDAESGFICGENVVNSANDIHELAPMIEIIRQECDIIAIETISDSGYADLHKIEKLVSDENLKIFCALAKPKTGKDFIYDSAKDIYLCSQNKELRRNGSSTKENGSVIKNYICHECGQCPIKAQCTQSKFGRTKKRFTNQEFRDNYREQMESNIGKEKMKIRRKTIECVNGSIKCTAGKIPIQTRGKEKVTNEIKLHVLMYNIRHLMNMFSLSKIIELCMA